RISASLGFDYNEFISTAYGQVSRNADLVAHFFRRAFRLLATEGAFGLIATNTIGQGDTREAGLMSILDAGGSIYRAQKRLRWPGEAAVIVSTVHVTKGTERVPVLDGHQVN